MDRFLTFRYIKSVTQSLSNTQRGHRSRVGNYGASISASLCSRTYRIYSTNGFSGGGCESFTRYITRGAAQGHYSSNSFSVLSRSNTMAQHAQITWKKLSQKCHSSGYKFPDVNKIAQTGWQRKLDPGYNVMQTLQSLLLKEDWAKSLLYTVDGLMAP